MNDSITTLLMTEEMHRTFIAGGCDPACHTCGATISVGEMFALRCGGEVRGFKGGSDVV